MVGLVERAGAGRRLGDSVRMACDGERRPIVTADLTGSTSPGGIVPRNWPGGSLRVGFLYRRMSYNTPGIRGVPERREGS